MMNGDQADRGEARLGPRVFVLRPGVVAGIAAGALDVGWVLDVRGDGFSARDGFVAVMLALAAATGVIGSAIDIPRVRGAALAWTSGVLLAIGTLSISSIGLPLLVAGGVAAAAMLGSVGHGAPRRTVVAVAAALITAFTVVFIGVVATR